MNERNLALLLQYDGTNYVGWQRQAPGRGVSVQQRVEEALSTVFLEPIVIAGAGRTDSGVHAAGQCCTFPVHKPLPVEKLPRVVNAQLPPDVRVTAAWEAPPSFHARFSAKGKRYRYLIDQGGADNAFNYRYAWRLPQPLDVAAMEEAAGCLLGVHDFRHFTLTGASVQNFVRELTALRIQTPPSARDDFPWRQWTRPLTIEAEGSGFLYKMVRIIVGRLVAVGQGRLSPAQFAAYLDGSFARRIPPAPAQGLMLMEVKYDSAESGCPVMAEDNKLLL